MRKLIWAFTAAFGGFSLFRLLLGLLTFRFALPLSEKNQQLITATVSAILALIALLAAGSRNQRRQQLAEYAKHACAPESDRKRLQRQPAAEIAVLILLNLLFAAAALYYPALRHG